MMCNVGMLKPPRETQCKTFHSHSTVVLPRLWCRLILVVAARLPQKCSTNVPLFSGVGPLSFRLTLDIVSRASFGILRPTIKAPPPS